MVGKKVHFGKHRGIKLNRRREVYIASLFFDTIMCEEEDYE